MKILALEHELPGVSAEKFQQFSKAEAAMAWELHQAGAIRELFFRSDRHSAVLVLECPSTEVAASMLAELPFVKNCLIYFELIPLQAYPGFARLFNRESGLE